MSCCCDPGCDIFTDLFTRADSPTVDGWTVQHGTWEIDTNTLRTSSPSASIVSDTAHPDGIGEGYVKASFNAHDNDKLRLLIDWLDDSNYHFAQITVGTNGCIELYRRAGGFNTLLTRNIINLDYTTTLTPELYFGEGYITVELNSVKICKTTTTVGGTKAGVGTDSVVGEVTIDDFYFKRYYSEPDHTDCPRITCADSCVIQSDTFNRDDSTNVGCVWEEVFGDHYAITSNTLRTSNSDSIIKCLTPNPEDSYDGYVACTIYGADGDKLRLFIDYFDEHNCHYVQFTIGTSGCIELYRRSGGTDTILTKKTCSITPSSATSVQLYLGEGYLTGTVGSTSACHKISYIGGKHSALGTGAISGEVRFDAFSYQFYYDITNHPTCPQTSCTTDCLIDSDNFTRADSSNLGCSWYEYLGNWRIESNKLKIDTDNAVLQFSNAQPEGIASYHVSLTVEFAYNTSVRILLDLNGGNFIYAEVKWTDEPQYEDDGDGGLILTQGAGGCLSIVNSAGILLDAKNIIPPVGPGGTFTFQAGLSNNVFYATVTDKVVCITPYSGTSKYVGIGTGSLNGNTLAITNFEFRRGKTDDFPACSYYTCATNCDWSSQSGREQEYWGPISCIFDDFIGSWDFENLPAQNPPWAITTSDSNAIMYHKVSNPAGDNLFLEARITFNAYGSEAIVAFNYNTLAHTYDYIKISNNTAGVAQDGKIQIYSGGSLIRELVDIDIFNVQYFFRLCIGKNQTGTTGDGVAVHPDHTYDGTDEIGSEIVYTSLDNYKLDAELPYTCSSGNDRSFAFGTGTVTGPISFSSWSQSASTTDETYTSPEVGCTFCLSACNQCTNGTTPDIITLTFGTPAFRGAFACDVEFSNKIYGNSFELERYKDGSIGQCYYSLQVTNISIFLTLTRNSVTEEYFVEGNIATGPVGCVRSFRFEVTVTDGDCMINDTVNSDYNPAEYAAITEVPANAFPIYLFTGGGTVQIVGS